MIDKPYTYSCVILDDDPTSLLILENYVSRLPGLKVVGAFTDVSKAVDSLNELNHIDFLFLDIRMPVSGIEVAKRIRERISYLIFTTAYPEYALDAFGVHADHYLVKPIGFESFHGAVNQTLARNGLKQIASEGIFPLRK